MDKQKVFWVVLSVSVFVVVVLVAGVLLLRQQPTAAPRATVSPMNGTGTQLYEYQREVPQTAPATGPQAGTPPAGDQQTMHFYIGEGAKTGPSTAPAGAPSPSSPAAPSTLPAAGTPAPAVPSLAGPATPARPAPPQASKPRTVKPTLQTRAPRKGPDYWIQTGSYKSQAKAEDLVSLLQGKGLGSRVFSWSSKGGTFFRVRVGPYSNKGEADKFLALVQQVQGLETSYISMVPARTFVN
jgi:cell division protein FtsN